MGRMILCFSLLVCASLASAETPFQFGVPNDNAPTIRT